MLLLVSCPFLRNSTSLIHNCSQCCVHERETREGFSVFVSWALIPHACPLYSRKSWTQADHSVDFAGLLASCHSLLERVYGRYTGAPVSARPAQTTVSASNAASGDAWLALLCEQAEQVTSHLPAEEALRGGHCCATGRSAQITRTHTCYSLKDNHR